MPENPEEDKKQFLYECQDDLLKQFQDYDDALTGVASWRSVFGTSTYKDKVVFFDWFPSVPIASGKVVTPDFAVLFNDKYGFICEIKAGFPKTDESFDKELEQIQIYDDIVSLKDNEDMLSAVERKDIVLMIRSLQSPDEVAKRIVDRLNDPKHFFKIKKSNLIIMEYRFDNSRGKSFYVMRRIDRAGNGIFQQAELNDYVVTKLKQMPVPPKMFACFKSQYIVINDPAPLIFRLVFLWMHAFYEMLNADQKATVTDHANFKYELEISVEEAVKAVNKIFDRSVFSKSEMQEALNSLQQIKLAKIDKETGKYLVQYKDLVRTRKRRHEEDAGEDKRGDIARYFAEEICRAQLEQKLKKADKHKPNPNQKEFEGFN